MRAAVDLNKQAIVRFLRPDWKRAVVFAVLLFIALAGYMQSWVFSGKDMGLPKPPFFDLLEPFPFWVLWVASLVPLAMLSNIIVMLAGYNADFVMRGPFWSFWVIQLLYFYLVSCLAIALLGRLGRRSRPELTAVRGSDWNLGAVLSSSRIISHRT